MKIEDFIGNEETVFKLTDWLNRYYHAKTFDTEPYAIIEGTTGNGKTTLVYALANSFRVYVHRVTVDDVSNSNDFKLFLKSLNIQSIYHLKTKKLILIDDFDDFSNSKKLKLFDVYKLSVYPIIYCINSLQSLPQNQKTEEFLSKAVVVKVKKPLSSKLAKLLEKKSKELDLKADSKTIEVIAQKSLSVRSAINSLYNCSLNSFVIPNTSLYEKRKLLLQKKLDGIIDYPFLKFLFNHLNCYTLEGLMFLNFLSKADIDLKVKRKKGIDSFILNATNFISKVKWLRIEKSTKPSNKLERKDKEDEQYSKPKKTTSFSVTDYF